MGFSNSYADAGYAEAYAKLELPGTYYLAYRDLPAIFRRHVKGAKALDFGCGAGRSTRFLRQHGFEVTGVDISEEMIDRARRIDPAGDYRLIVDNDSIPLAGAAFDLTFSAFTFDNVATAERKVAIFRRLRRLLHRDGRIVNLVSSPAIYTHEWASFSTKDFPENRTAGSGDEVRIVVTDLEDRRPVVDILWTDADYRATYRGAGLDLVQVHRPLGRASEPYAWVNETRISPWSIYVLSAGSAA